MCFEKLIGCTLGDLKLREISQEVVEMGIKGFNFNDKLQKPILILGSGVKDGEIEDGDAYVNPDGQIFVDEEGHKKIRGLMEWRLKQSDINALYDGGRNPETGEIVLGIHPNKAPLHAAMRAIQLRYAKFEGKKAEDILLSPEMQTIRFPDCTYAREASLFASNATRQTIRYMKEEC